MEWAIWTMGFNPSNIAPLILDCGDLSCSKPPVSRMLYFAPRVDNWLLLSSLSHHFPNFPWPPAFPQHFPWWTSVLWWIPFLIASLGQTEPDQNRKTLRWCFVSSRKTRVIFPGFQGIVKQLKWWIFTVVDFIGDVVLILKPWWVEWDFPFISRDLHGKFHGEFSPVQYEFHPDGSWGSSLRAGIFGQSSGGVASPEVSELRPGTPQEMQELGWSKKG